MLRCGQSPVEVASSVNGSASSETVANPRDVNTNGKPTRWSMVESTDPRIQLQVSLALKIGLECW